MNEDFFRSEVIQAELDDLQTTYNDLLQMSSKLNQLDKVQQLEHINKTLELIAKQKVFYARLQLMSNYVTDDDDGSTEAVKEVKERIDQVSQIYSGGNNLLNILQAMEDKLLCWKKDLEGVDKA
jgi:hypothetical protein|tara:strand:+ start:9135 stop:9506 length:372 start_codon:yes stop_codon:yes gene_type:complete